jgi:hypothetical protein
MSFTMRWQFGSPVLPPVNGPVIRKQTDGAPRLGETVSVENPSGLPVFVQVQLPANAGYETSWVELDLRQPTPFFELGPQHLGMRVRVIAKGIGADGNPNGQDIVSNEIGPVLPAVDPAGTTVANVSQLASAVSGGASVIILAAGTTWDGADFGRTIANATITTPQDNPARIVDSYCEPTAWTNVTLEGVHFYGAAAWATTNRSQMLDPAGTCTGVVLRGVKFYGDDIPRSVYQAIPADIANSPYRGTGMAFMPNGLSTRRCRGVVIEGMYCRNVDRPLVASFSTVVRHLRAHGFYNDGIQVNGGQSIASDRLDFRGYYLSDCYAVYDEIDFNAASGTGNSPHPDPIQFAASDVGIIEPVIDEYAVCIGDTRAFSWGGVVPTIITTAKMFRGRYRRILAQGIGTINWYQSGGDAQLDYVTKIKFTGPGGGNLRFGGELGDHENEARISRSIVREPVLTQGFTQSGYYVTDASVVDPVDPIQTFIQGTGNARPATLADLAIMARPRPGSSGMGTLTETGHMRPLGALPSTPAFTLSSSSGGFTATFAAVTGAEEYQIRYRVAGGTGAWVRQSATGLAASAANLGSQLAYDVQGWVKTADGLSNWSASQTVTTGTVTAINAPSIAWEPSTLGILSQFTGSTATARTHTHPITFSTPPNGSASRLVLAMIKMRAGVTGGSTSPQSFQFVDAGGATQGTITALSGASYTASPGGNWWFMRIGEGVPGATATQARIALSSNSFSASYMRAGLWGVPTVLEQARNSSSSTLTMSNVPPGVRIIVQAIFIGTAAGTWTVANGAASPPPIVPVDGQSDTSGNGDCRVEVVTIAATTGGTFTISCAGAAGLSAVAYRAA